MAAKAFANATTLMVRTSKSAANVVVLIPADIAKKLIQGQSESLSRMPRNNLGAAPCRRPPLIGAAQTVVAPIKGVRR